MYNDQTNAIHSKDSGVRQTTLEAYDAIIPHLSTLQSTVYCAILRASQGLTDNEICSVTGIGGSTVRPRRIELERMGLIMGVGVRKGINGRSSIVWRNTYQKHTN